MSTHAGYAETCNERETATAGSAWFSMLAYFLREIAGSPVRLFRVAWRIVKIGPSLVGAFQLLRIRPLARFVYANPKFLFKHLPPKYLLRDIPARTRTACFVHHYRRLHMLLSERLFERVLEEDIVLYRICTEEHRFGISLGRARDVKGTRQVAHEGELNLNLVVDDALVYVLSFTIVPGWVVDAEAAEVLVITRVQGSLNVYAQISQVSRSMHGIPPEMLLITALQGVSEAFGIRTMAGVSAERHLCYDLEDEALFKRAYDELFTKIGAVKNDAGYYLAALPLAERAPAQGKRGKSRTKARRALKQQVAASACGCLRGQKPAGEERLAEAAEEDRGEPGDALSAPAINNVDGLPRAWDAHERSGRAFENTSRVE